MKRNTIYLLVGVAVFSAVTLIGFNKLGEQAGAKSQARLALVWPSFDSMAQQDKAILAGYALTCELNQTELAKKAVLECLNSAANEPNVLLPKGVSVGQARAKFEQLLPRE